MKYEMITETMKEIKKKSQKLWHQRNKNAFFFFWRGILHGFYSSFKHVSRRRIEFIDFTIKFLPCNRKLFQINSLSKVCNSEFSNAKNIM